VTEPTDPEYLIEGERVALGPLRRDLAATYARWLNNLDTRAGLAHLGILERTTEETWIDETLKSDAGHHPRTATFTIYDREDAAPLGTCSLMDIDHHHRRARFGIFLGERRGGGRGTEATRLTLDWAFNILGLRNVLLEVFPWNASAIRAYENAGFKLIGRRRDAIHRHGRRWDEILMDAVADEFAGSVLTGRIPTGE
jgi:diamine N-acetyltransferase